MESKLTCSILPMMRLKDRRGVCFHKLDKRIENRRFGKTRIENKDEKTERRKRRKK